MKVKYSLLGKLGHLTNKELSLFLRVARFQDDYGNIQGIYYKDIMASCGMCKQSFYNTLRALRDKGLIEYIRNDRGLDYDIKILDNDFSYKDAYSEGYINLSRKVFSTEKFNKLRAKEKVLLLHLMKISHSSKGRSYRIGTKKFYHVYGELLGVTDRVLRGYLHTLKDYFHIGVKDFMYFITLKANKRPELLDKLPVSEVDQYMLHLVLRSCRHHKVDSSDVNGKCWDAVTVIKQYLPFARERKKDIISLFDAAVNQCRMENKAFNIKYINLLLRRALGLPPAGLKDINEGVFWNKPDGAFINNYHE